MNLRDVARPTPSNKIENYSCEKMYKPENVLYKSLIKKDGIDTTITFEKIKKMNKEYMDMSFSYKVNNLDFKNITYSHSILINISECNARRLFKHKYNFSSIYYFDPVSDISVIDKTLSNYSTRRYEDTECTMENLSIGDML